MFSRSRPPRPIVVRVWRRIKTGPPVELADGLIPKGERVVQFCHPQWRGVRTATHAFGASVVELADLAPPARDLATRLASAGTERIVIQGWPPGAEALARHAHRAGLAVAVVSHASLAQHGTDAGEAERVSEVLDLIGEGIVDRIGFVKRGLAEAFTAMGHPAHPLTNRLPHLPAVKPNDFGPGDHVGVFVHPYWRKNVTTQIAAAMILGATAHVMHRPAVRYLPHNRIVEHGELPRERFLAALAGVDINLHVTLSECHPMTPMESYLLGVPCLISRTSSLFTDDPEFLALTSVVELDDPQRIAETAKVLADARQDAVPRAVASLRRMDTAAAGAWAAFVS